MSPLPKILVLYSEYMPYVHYLFSAVADQGYLIDVISRDSRRNSPYIPEPHDNITFYPRSKHGIFIILKMLLSGDYKAVLISGWQHTPYTILSLLALFSSSCKWYLLLDTVYRSTLKQKIAINLHIYRFFFNIFDYVWVPGQAQTELLDRAQLPPKKRLFGLYTSQPRIFSLDELVEPSDRDFTHFLFVGRLEPIKGVVPLLRAWSAFYSQTEKSCRLTIVGNGSLSSFVNSPEFSEYSVENIPYLTHQQLALLMNRCGAFVLPSFTDAFPNVVHEACLSGLALLLPTSVGSASTFLHHQENGFLMPSNSVDDILNSLHSYHKLSDVQKVLFSSRSRSSGQQITPQRSATGFIETLS